MLSKEKEVRLPMDAEEFDSFVVGIIRDFDLPHDDTTVEAIATQILHMDNRVGRARRSFFADCAVKFLANKAAYEKIEGFNAVRKAAAIKAKKEADEQKAREEAGTKSVTEHQQGGE